MEEVVNFIDPQSLSHLGQKFLGAAALGAGSVMGRKGMDYYMTPGKYGAGRGGGRRPVARSAYKSVQPRKRRAPGRVGNNPVAAEAYVRRLGRGINRVSGTYGRGSDFGGPVPVGKYIDHGLNMTQPGPNTNDFDFAINAVIPALIPPLTSTGLPMSTRTSNAVVITGLSIHGWVNVPFFAKITPFDSAPDDIMRICVYLDKQCNGASPATGDIMSLSKTSFGGPYIWGFENQDNGYRFEKLAMLDIPIKQAVVWNAATPSVDMQNAEVQFALDLKDLSIVIEYNNATGGTGGVTERRSNNLVVCFGGRKGMSEYFVKGTPKLTATVRTTFVDA